MPTNEKMEEAITSVRNGSKDSDTIALAQLAARFDFGKGGRGSRARKALKDKGFDW